MNQNQENFHMSRAYLIRLDNMLNHNSSCSLRDDYIAWIKGLMCIKRDIWGLLNERERETISVYLDKINISDPVNNRFRSRIEKRENTTRYINKIEELDQYFRGIIIQKGLILPMAESDFKGGLK